MTKKHSLKQDVTLIENLVQDQLNLIESKLAELERPDDPAEALQGAIASLSQLHELSTLTKALLGNLAGGD